MESSSSLSADYSVCLEAAAAAAGLMDLATVPISRSEHREVLCIQLNAPSGTTATADKMRKLLRKVKMRS